MKPIERIALLAFLLILLAVIGGMMLNLFTRWRAEAIRADGEREVMVGIAQIFHASADAIRADTKTARMTVFILLGVVLLLVIMLVAALVALVLALKKQEAMAQDMVEVLQSAMWRAPWKEDIL